jgi:acetyl esterase
LYSAVMNTNIPTHIQINGLKEGVALDAQCREVLMQAAALFNGIPAAELAPARRRAITLEANQQILISPDLLPVASQSLEIVLPGRSLPARLYEPAQITSDTLLVYFHGGGWVLSDLDTHHQSSQFLAQHLGMKLLSVQYRKAPECSFPAPCDDAEQALAWAQARLASWGCPRVAVSGDSAGGHLAAVAMHMQPGVAGALLFYPVTDVQFDGASYQTRGAGPGLTKDAMVWYWQQFLNPALPASQLPSSNDARAVPMRQIWQTPPPPTVISAAWHDPLYDDSQRYAQHLAQAGGKVLLHSAPDMPHGFVRHVFASSSARAHVLAAVHAFRALIG